MDRISIGGGRRLNGTIPISGAKNAALPLMIASLLTAERLTLKNVPNLADVNLLARILRNHGVDFTVDGKRADATRTCGETFHSDRARHRRHHRALRAGEPHARELLGAGPAARALRQARVSLPGGCAIGTRPVDLHLMGLEGARRGDRHRRRLCGRQGAGRAAGARISLPQGLGGRDP